MKVVHCSTAISESSVVLRLHRALQKQGVDSKIITLRAESESEGVFLFKSKVLASKVHNMLERIEKIRYRLQRTVPFCSGRIGYDLSKLNVINDADIIHLHWVSGNFLSIYSINKLLGLGKPIIWTLHDSWPLTGGCHVKYDCERFKTGCGTCPFLVGSKEADVTRRNIKDKKKLIVKDNMILVAPSGWMAENISSSTLFNELRHYIIPNTLDRSVFKSFDRQFVENKLRYRKNDRIVILFGAMAGTSTEYKGFKYLKEALKIVERKYPQYTDKIELHIFGTENFYDKDLESYYSMSWGMVRDAEKLAYIYNLADVYAFPSIDDNLPSTVMESLSCATPVVTFNTGGIPDMVKHKTNGYIAEPKDSEDFANGLVWVIENNKNNVLGYKGERFVQQHYTEEIIAQKHIELYKEVLKRNK